MKTSSKKAQSGKTSKTTRKVYTAKTVRKYQPLLEQEDSSKVFDQVKFFECLRDKMGVSDYQIAERVEVSRHLYSHYVTGRNRVRLATVLLWASKLELSEKDIVELFKKSRG